MRYKFYREHKYVSFALNDFERKVAKANFREFEEIEALKIELESIIQMLKGHAHYENSKLHELLRKKSSAVYAHIEEDHEKYDQILDRLISKMGKVLTLKNPDERVKTGYQFYLEYRKFVGENLLHLHEEETVILPELQNLYTDDELRAVEFDTYRRMTSDEMVDMIKVLFPHMNPDDKEAFLKDIKDSEPKKFKEIWIQISPYLEKKENGFLAAK
jgi:hypothetical protein